VQPHAVKGISNEVVQPGVGLVGGGAEGGGTSGHANRAWLRHCVTVSQ
jgi:hypothetical protein